MEKIILVIILAFFIGNASASFISTDNIPPSSITGLNNITYKPIYINWTWHDPKDIDFAKVMIYINSGFKTNVSKGKRYYNSTGLLPNRTYKISTHTIDYNGNINKTWVNKTAKTARDYIPPASISGLNNITYKPIYINWTWKDPTTFDFEKVMIYIDGKFKTYVPKGRQFYNASGLKNNTWYKISARTVDTSGNINLTWVNKTSKTAEIISYPDKIEMKGEVSQLISSADFSIKKWNRINFAGFIYDIDSNKGTESMNILKFKDNRTIDKDNLIYTTIRTPQKYKAFEDKGLTIENGLDANLNKPTSPARGGYYAIVGWMGEKYVGVNGKNNKLSKLVLEQNIIDKKTLKLKESWNLGEGYSLTVQGIDRKGLPMQAWFVLYKNGVKLDDMIGVQGQVYTYSMILAGEYNVPIFVTYTDNITNDTVRLKYTTVISTNVTEIKAGDIFGVFKVDTEDPLILSNYGSVSLTRGSTIKLFDNMKFKISNSEDNDVRFYPSVEITTPGIYEVRGTVSQLTSKSNFSIAKWDGRNFAGFWYDIDGNKQTEILDILRFKDNRTLDKGNLTYTTIRTPQKYKAFEDKGLTIENGLDANLNRPTARGGYYAIVGWMGEKYVGVNGKNNKLSKLVLEQDSIDKKTLLVGEKWNLGEGYSLTVQGIDPRSSPRQVLFILYKNGVKLGDMIGVQGEVYTYSMILAGEYSVPIFVTYVEGVFAGGSTNSMVQLKYTWLISENVKEVNTGDRFGIFEVDTEQPLSLRNYGMISLARGSTINLFGNMNIKVANSRDNDVRFYPKIDYQILRNNS